MTASVWGIVVSALLAAAVSHFQMWRVEVNEGRLVEKRRFVIIRSFTHSVTHSLTAPLTYSLIYSINQQVVVTSVKQRAAQGKLPLKLLYTSNIPLAMFAALAGNIFMVSQVGAIYDCDA